MTDQVCRLAAIVRALPGHGESTLVARRDGVLATRSYADCHRDAVRVARALVARGVRPGDTVAVHGVTSYEWVLADLACVLAGAISVALYPSAPPDRVLAAAREARCRVLFTDQPALADVAVEFDVIALDPSTMDSLGGDAVLPERPDGPFTVVSTSGTLSEPKLFGVHSRPLLHTMERFAELYGIDGRDRLLLYLPLSHLPQRMMLYWGLSVGLDFVLSDPVHMVADTGRTRPTLSVGVPRSLEHLHGRATKAIAGGTESARAYATLFGDRLKALFVGSAPSDPAVLTDLREAGVPVYEVYGTTELGMIGLNRPDANRPGTVGKPIPWGAVRLDKATREVLVRTPTPFRYGELVDGKVVPVVRDPEEWVSTGDVGSFDGDGFLTLLGRLRDFVPLRSGEKVFVKPIEDALCRRTGATHAVLVLVDGTRLHALLFFTPESLRDPDALASDVTTVNKTLHRWERVRAFAVVGRLPTAEEGCVTETTKLRRHRIEEVHGRHAAWTPLP